MKDEGYNVLVWLTLYSNRVRVHHNTLANARQFYLSGETSRPMKSSHLINGHRCCLLDSFNVTVILVIERSTNIRLSPIVLQAWAPKTLTKLSELKHGSNEISLPQNHVGVDEVLNVRQILSSEKRFLIPRRRSNLQPSDDRWDALTIELPRLRWWAKVEVRHKCDLSGNH